MVPLSGGYKNMNDWHTTCLGLKRLPRELSGFEIEAFFNFSAAERRVIEERRKPGLMLGLALQIGFLRMSGRLLEAVGVVPPALWRHLGDQFNVVAPDLASLRAMYRRRRTLFEHQDVACTTLGFQPLTEAQRRALVRVLRDELSRTIDRQRLLGFARRWLYKHRLLVPRERDLRMLIRKAVRSHEAVLARSILETVKPLLRAEWYGTLTEPRPDGMTTQTWLWAAPAKHSTRQIDSLLERIDCRYRLGVDHQLTDLPDAILRRYARRLASRPPAVGARIGEPVRTIEVATLLALRRALRNGTVWIEHSFAFRSRERLFIPAERWQQTRRAQYRRLALPTEAGAFLEPLLEQSQHAIARVADAAVAGELRVDDELHLTPLAAEVRFSWIMLGREPRSDKELLMVYAGILAHGTALSAAETARMIPQLSAPAIPSPAPGGGRISPPPT